MEEEERGDEGISVTEPELHKKEEIAENTDFSDDISNSPSDEMEPVRKRPIILTKSKHCNRNGRKYWGMKSYEVRHILDQDDIKFCEDVGLLGTYCICPCGKKMTKLKRGRWYGWFCKRKNEEGKFCKSTLSHTRNTWFDGCRISAGESLWLAYMWVHEYSYNSLVHECDHSVETIVEYLSRCRDVCQGIMESRNEPLGGIGRVVDLYECKCTGKFITEQWVFCAIEQFSTKSVLVIMTDKKSKSLLEVFDQYILPDTTVVNDIWNMFNDFEQEEFDYLTEKKSLTFYDTVTKSEIRNIDKMWVLANRPPALNAFTKYEYGTKFCEQMYRKVLGFSDDAFMTYLQDIAKVYPPITQFKNN